MAGPPAVSNPASRARKGGLWLGAATVVVGLEAALIAGLAWAPPRAFDTPLPPPILVELIEPPPPPEPEPEPAPTEAPAAASPAPAPPAPAPRIAPPQRQGNPPRLARLKPPPDVQPIQAAAAPPGPPLPLLGSGALAGAARAGQGVGGGGGGDGSGSGGSGSGGGCDLLQRVQDALRRNAGVRRAVEAAHRDLHAAGKAIQIWNGDWLQSQGQSGKGLAGVRQAIALEVAFAPAACRAQAMRGLAVVSLDDSVDGAKLALGTGRWRWSDLLGLG